MSTTLTTYTFGDIFRDYTSWYNQFSKYLDCVGEDPTPEVAAFDKYCYQILWRQFATQCIRYDRIEPFTNVLGNLYEQQFHQFYREKELLDKYYRLSEDELLKVGDVLTNAANNPNTKPTNPLAPFEFVSAQTYTHERGNKLEAYLKALSNLPSLNIQRFIFGDRTKRENKYELHFSDLFLQILPKEIILY